MMLMTPCHLEGHCRGNYKTSAVPKREPTEGSLNDYLTKGRRDIRHSKKTAWRIHKHRLNLYGIRSTKSRERNPISPFVICLSLIEMSYLIVTLLIHWHITFLIILPMVSAQMHSYMYVTKLKSRILTLWKYTTGLSLCRSCRVLYVEPMILQQDQMKYIINF